MSASADPAAPPPAGSRLDERGPATRAGPSEVLLGLGANLGDPLRQLREAVRALRGLFGAVTYSSVYRSAPVGYVDQADFFNLVCRAETTLSPPDLLAETQRIERSLGRRPAFRNAPRPIDIDLLAYGREVATAPGLVVPHPRLHERAFVLVPLREIAPEWRHPVSGLTPAEMIRAAGRLEAVQRVGRLEDDDRGT